MIKQKLINKRVEKNLSQEELASLLGITQSQYSRRENGQTKISKKEWDKMAKLLDTPLEDIYEPEDGVYVFHNENASGNFGNNNTNTYNSFSDFAIETMKKYIEKLEQENLELRKKLADT